MLLLRVAERDSLEGSSLKVGVEGGVGTMASFQAPHFVCTIAEVVAVGNGPKLWLHVSRRAITVMR
jgi:hypothetical protein